MPHVTRHTRKRKKPKRTKPLGLTEDQLPIHRELALLRIAGGARPGRHKDKLMQERIAKLDAVVPRTPPTTESIEEKLLKLQEHFNSKRGFL